MYKDSSAITFNKTNIIRLPAEGEEFKLPFSHFYEMGTSVATLGEETITLLQSTGSGQDSLTFITKTVWIQHTRS